MELQKRVIGIKDVALAAGVSISTVSNVLNDTRPVSEGLRARVLQAVEALGYHANVVARGLKSGKTNMLCVIVPSIMSVFFPRVMHGMQNAASERGYSLSIYETDQRLEKEQAIIQRLKEQWVDGILLSTCAGEEDSAYLDTLAKLNCNGKPIPVVCYEAVPASALDAVVVDHRAAAKSAVSCLLARDRSRVAHIAAPLRFAMGRLRRDGYLDAMREAGLVPAAGFIQEGDYSPQSGFSCMRALLHSAQRPDAVFCGNDQMAIGAMRAILDAGLRIPEDIAVMGFDNNFPGTLVSPSLSTVSVPKQLMGKEAVALLLRRIEEGPSSPRRVITLETNCIERQSTDLRAQSGWDLHDW